MSLADTTKQHLLLIDGHSMAYRAFYALPADNFRSSSGQPTNAIYGFASMIINLLKEERPTHIAVAFDVSRKTFRSERFPEYKAQRSSTPDEFRSQLSHINELVTAFGIKYFAVEGFEADDIIATLAKRAELENFKVSICTGDRDAFQLVNQQTTVLYPKKGVTEMTRMTPDSLFEKYGLTPLQYADFAALRGDPSDNLPSLPGVGEKTATKWIVDYGSLAELLSHVDEVTGKVGQALRENIDSVKLNRELTQLVDNMDLEVKIQQLTWQGFDTNETNKIFDQLEIKALKERIKVLPQIGLESQSIQAVDSKVIPISSAEISAIIATTKTPVSIHIEVIENRLNRYAVATDPLRIYEATDVDIGAWINDSKIKKIAHGAKWLIKKFNLAGLISDVEILAYLNN
jgi:DNA polymerase-1